LKFFKVHLSTPLELMPRGDFPQSPKKSFVRRHSCGGVPS